MSARLAAFLALLEREQAALVRGDAAEVERIALEKQDALRELPADAGRDASPRLLSQLRALNAQNGRLIGWRLGRLEARLAVLGAGPEGPTYDATGTARGRFSPPGRPRGPGSW